MSRRKKNKTAEMPILDHFSELRRRLVIVVVCLLVATVAIYFISPQLIEWLKKPISQFLPGTGTGELYVLDPLTGFTLRFKVSFLASVMVTAPIWIWNILAFFLPALKPHERKWVLPTFFVGVFLFIAGNIFCYFIILRPAFEWLLGQVTPFATVFPDASTYVSAILMFELAFGVAFELPLITFYLIVFNIVPYKMLRKSWRVVYIVLMVFCAAVTPDASPVTMLLLYAAMVGLYEISLALARVALRKRIERQRAEEEREALEDA
ncbi:MAG: twin-arginine translocase subunit TatC [Coriobacteriales bacterium]|jgi:sec-independent protein translocase protein TatC